jgi:hypothetical protein
MKPENPRQICGLLLACSKSKNGIAKNSSGKNAANIKRFSQVDCAARRMPVSQMAQQRAHCPVKRPCQSR